MASHQLDVTTVFAAMQDDPGKFADLQRAKYIMGLGHPITREITNEQMERVFAALEACRSPQAKLSSPGRSS